MAEAALTFLLENLKELLADQVELISEAKNELNQLQNELKLLKAFLVDSANKREKGQLFREYERQIRDAVYDAEDTLDRTLANKSRGLLGKMNLSLAREVRSVRVDKIGPVFDEAKRNFANLRFADASAQKTTDNSRKIPLLRPVRDIVGFEDEADTLIKYLNEESEQLEVTSIIGMPGLGKTTLAWKIYHDSRIIHEFPTLIWVYVSQEFNRRDVFLTILRKFTKRDMSSRTDDELAEKVHSYLEKPKFLLIMDDVWTTEAWKDIEASLPRSNKMGKILITSRNKEVAWRANRKREPHGLRFLKEEESWKLLQLEVFGEVGKCPSDLETLGRGIAKQCGGVPLAIVVIGGILDEKNSTIEGDSAKRREWENVSTSVSTYLISDDKEKRTENIIALSYDKLPHDLRDCFLYLGMFPEDTEILAWKLIRLWIAEGFVKQKPNRSVEEVAEDNLKDLINRNLVMVDKIKAERDIKSCRVHDMIREFCKKEAGIDRQNLFQEVKKSKEGVFVPPVSEIKKHRRLCIHSHVNVMGFLEKKPDGPSVRSLLCFSKENIILPEKHTQSIPVAFDLLRVLDINPIKFTRFPTKLTHLIHLRYIALSGDKFKALPKTVSELWNLQTIRINTMEHVFEIKADIWKMMQLRHLKTKAAIILNKDVKGKAGENLQTLSRLSAECCTEKVLNKASNLKNLGIRGQLSVVLESNCLKILDHLQKLKLVYDDLSSGNRLCGLPTPDKFPPNLRILELSATFLEWKHMSTLGKLTKLEVLKLKENAFMGKCWDAIGGGFSSLEFLHIGRTDLEFWTASCDSIPRLRCLVLRNCEKLAEIPIALAKSLQTLDLERVTKSAVASARKIEQEKQQMQGQERGKRGGFKLLIAPGDERI